EFVNEITGGRTPPDLAAWAQTLRKAWEEKQAAKKKSPAAAATPVKKEKVQAGFSRAMTQAAQEGLPVVSVSADLAGSTGVAAFQKAVPGRSFDIGVAEANMISTCTGLAKTGFLPVADTFSQFGITKGNLPLIMAALSQGPVVGAFTHAGFQDAADGASHEATTYLAAVSSIPHTLAISPCCSDQAYGRRSDRRGGTGKMRSFLRAGRTFRRGSGIVPTAMRGARRRFFGGARMRPSWPVGRWCRWRWRRRSCWPRTANRRRSSTIPL
ncbi:MAG: hypothetical protein EBT95_05615, partial [Verrucomicrobia bacterium]|nr:hypothetical protein [Verrucomicrobiota bacterium]